MFGTKEADLKSNQDMRQASGQDTVRISVRTLVEFILRSGDIDTRLGRIEADAMQEGSRLHRKIQKGMDGSYSAEVPLALWIPVSEDGEEFDIVIEGRADGVVTREEEGKSFLIDEIKCTYRDVNFLPEPVPVHLAQARCYAYMLAAREGLLSEALPAKAGAESPDRMAGGLLPEKTDTKGGNVQAWDVLAGEPAKTFGVQITYCNIESEEIRRFSEELSEGELSAWFDGLIGAYRKWAVWERKWIRTRNESIKKLVFPYPYREGQKDFAAGVYRTILREKKLFAMAPTGVGKTLSTVFPAVKAMGEGKAGKLFYLTAKTMQRTVAEETFALLIANGLKLKSVTLTAKEKVCVLDKPECNPFACPRAKGHFDRINGALYEMLSNEETVTREKILSYAEKYSVCPFEFCLDLTLWADAVIGDYNYVFDPDASLKRFFATETKQEYVFLIDEAHNLVERAREMYSATLVKEDFLKTKKLFGVKQTKLVRRIDACNKAMLALKRECDSFLEVKEFDMLMLTLNRFLSEAEEYLKDEAHPKEEREGVLSLYFAVRSFCAMYDFSEEDYRYYTSYAEDGSFYARVQCMRPRRPLAECLKKGKSAIFFSATLLPVKFYMEELCGDEENYAIYVPSPFSPEKRKLLIARDVSYKYSMRGAVMYEKAAEYIFRFAGARRGNYFVFFSSYLMLQEVGALLEEKMAQTDYHLLYQKRNMDEEERETFLEAFSEEGDKPRIGLCVLGGIFGEGIDLVGERLVGAVIVGTGLPFVCDERELFRRFYEEQGENGFDRAYLYPGMNKVQQAAGRVIRTMEDMGAVLLLDMRFTQKSYTDLFPREWAGYETVTIDTAGKKLEEFWKEMDG